MEHTVLSEMLNLSTEAAGVPGGCFCSPSSSHCPGPAKGGPKTGSVIQMPLHLHWGLILGKGEAENHPHLAKQFSVLIDYGKEINRTFWSFHSKGQSKIVWRFKLAGHHLWSYRKSDSENPGVVLCRSVQAGIRSYWTVDLLWLVSASALIGRCDMLIG